MKAWDWLWLALALGALACGSKDGPSYGDLPDYPDDDSTDSDEEQDAGKNGNNRRDSGDDENDDENDDDESSDNGNPNPGPVDNTCFSKPVTARPTSPEFLIVLDRSGSMIGLGTSGGLRWEPSVSAVQRFTSELTETVKFGLMMFPGVTGSIIPGLPALPGLDDEARCAAGTLEVPIDLNTAGAIAQSMRQTPPDFGQTPTATTMQAALEVLNVNVGDTAPVPRYVLLITDGQPNCGADLEMTLPEDVTAVDAALDALFEVGIKTFVIGYDMASNPGLAANMDEFAQHGGTERAYAVEDEQSLIDELTRITGALVSCEIDVSEDDELETIDPAYLRVEIDGTTYEYGTDWILEEKKVVLLEGAGACSKLRDARLHRINVTRECTPVFVQ